MNGRLLITCPDRHGIVAAVSGFLAERDANILSSDQHSTDPEGGTFFMRMEFRLESLGVVLLHGGLVAGLGLSPGRYLLLYALYGLNWSAQQYITHAASPRRNTSSVVWSSPRVVTAVAESVPRWSAFSCSWLMRAEGWSRLTRAPDADEIDAPLADAPLAAAAATNAEWAV